MENMQFLKITTRVANPCGFKMKARQSFLFSKEKSPHFLPKESNEQRNDCNRQIKNIHYGLLIFDFLPHAQLNSQKKSPALKGLSITENKVFAFIFIHLAKWIRNYTIDSKTRRM